MFLRAAQILSWGCSVESLEQRACTGEKDCFYFFHIINNTVMNIFVDFAFHILCEISPRSKIARSRVMHFS